MFGKHKGNGPMGWVVTLEQEGLTFQIALGSRLSLVNGTLLWSFRWSTAQNGRTLYEWGCLFVSGPKLNLLLPVADEKRQQYTC